MIWPLQNRPCLRIRGCRRGLIPQLLHSCSYHRDIISGAGSRHVSSVANFDVTVPSQTVLVLGASGGVGRAATQLAHAMGARVLAGILRPERVASVRAAGADAVIDLSAADLRDSLRSQVYAATEGRVADIILDPLGGPIFEAAMRALAWRGRLVVIGFAAGPIPTIRTNYLLLKNVEISGLQISDYRKRRPALVAACFAEIFSLYEEGRIRPAKAIAFPLGRAGEALAALRDRRIAGRAVLQLYQ